MTILADDDDDDHKQSWRCSKVLSSLGLLSVHSATLDGRGDSVMGRESNSGGESLIGSLIG